MRVPAGIRWVMKSTDERGSQIGISDFPLSPPCRRSGSWRTSLASSLAVCSFGLVVLNAGAQETLQTVEPLQAGLTQGLELRAQGVDPLPLQFPDGTSITLTQGSWLHLENASFDESAPESDQLVVRLVKGGLRAVTGRLGARGNPDAFEVRTPVGSIGIRGTEFEMIYCEAGDCDPALLAPLPEQARSRIEQDGGLYYSVSTGAIAFRNTAGEFPLEAGRWGYASSRSRPPVEGAFPRQEELPPQLRAAIVDAINTNPEVQERWNAYLAAEETGNIARGRFFPEIDLSLSAARQYQEGGDVDRVQRDPLRADITLNQMIYDGFFTSADVRRLGHARMVRYYELLEAAEQAALNAIRAYADVERQRELVFLAEENYHAHRLIYDQVVDLARTGVGRGVDLEQVTGRVALAEDSLLAEIASLHDASARFLRVVGRTPPDEYVDLVGVMPTGSLPGTVDDAVRAAFATNPTIAASVENVMSAYQQVRVGRSYHHPKLDFRIQTARDNALNSTFVRDGDEEWVTDTTIGLVLRFNLFRGFSDQARIGQFVEEANLAKDKRENVCRNVRQTVAIAFNDIRVLQEQLVYLNQHQTSSDRVRTGFQQQFAIGQRTMLDLLDTQNEFFEARRAYIAGLFNLELAYARALAGMGQLLPSLGIARDEMPEIDSETRIDPEELCPPMAPAMLQVERNSLFP
jgi:adhesin transport system outer membrane protein